LERGIELRNRKYNRNLDVDSGLDVWVRGEYGYKKELRIIDGDNIIEVIDRYRVKGNYISLFCEVSFEGFICEDFKFGGYLG